MVNKKQALFSSFNDIGWRIGNSIAFWFLVIWLLFFAISPFTLCHAFQSPEVTILEPIKHSLRSPLRMVMDVAGAIYVADPRNGGIQKFDRYGKHLRTIKTNKMAQGISVISDGTLIVTQEDAVILISADGIEKGRLGKDVGQFKKANGVTRDSNGRIYVVDTADDCVQVFTPDGQFIYRFPEHGRSGNGDGEFNKPTGIAFEKESGQIAVTDTLNGRIQFFDVAQQARFVKTLGSYGSGPLQFTQPQGITFEYTADSLPRLRRIYVVDTLQGDVQVIDPQGGGTFQTFLGSYGTADGQLMVPSDVLFDQQSKRLLVANGYGNLTLYGIDGGQSPVDTFPPVLSVTSVPAQTSTQQLSVSGTVEEGAAVFVSAGIGPAVETRVRLSAWDSVVSLAPGVNIIVVRAIDPSGNSTIQTVSTEYVVPPPALAINQPKTITNAENYLLSGTVESGSTVIVSNQASGLMNEAIVSGTEWHCQMPLVLGANQLSVSATHPSTPAHGVKSTNIIFDNVRPELLVSTIPHNATTAEQTQTIVGTVQDQNLSSVMINGEIVPVENGLFRKPLVLKRGENTLSITVLDAAGNETSESRIIYFDKSRPSLAVESPVEGFLTGTNVITVKGTAPETMTIRINGQLATKNGENWIGSLSLVTGINTIQIVGTNDVGKSFVQKRTVLYKNGAPEIAITSLPLDSVVNQMNMSISGSISTSEPFRSIMADLDGGRLPITYANGVFSTQLILAEEKTYAITITVTDAAGNEHQAKRHIILDKTPPYLKVNPAPLNPQVVDGLVDKDSIVSLYDKDGPVGLVLMDGSQWSVNLGSVTYDMASLKVRATDAGGNTRDKGLSFSLADGDLDNDGRVTLADALIALRLLAMGQTPTAGQLAHGDVGPFVDGKPHPDGVISIFDAMLILNKSVGLLSW